MEELQQPILDYFTALGFEEIPIEEGLTALSFEESPEGEYVLITDEDGSLPQAFRPRRIRAAVRRCSCGRAAWHGTRRRPRT